MISISQGSWKSILAFEHAVDVPSELVPKDVIGHGRRAIGEDLALEKHTHTRCWGDEHGASTYVRPSETQPPSPEANSLT